MRHRSRQGRVVDVDVLVVGIDVAKGRHVAAFRRGNVYRSGAFSFSNDRAGFEELLRRVEWARTQQSCRCAAFALEATGHYGHALRQYLTERGHMVLGINPAHTKRAKELDDNSPEKSDPKDADVIADLAVQGKGRLTVMPTGVYADLRRLGKLRERLVVERVRLRNRYFSLVDLLFPELAGLVRDAASRTMRRLLAECPTPADVVALGYEPLQDRLRRWSRGHIDPERSARIYRAASESVGIREGIDAARLELRLGLEDLARVDARLREVEEAQARALEQVPYAGLLLSIPGLGRVTVATILGETGDLRAYRDAEAVIKLAGYNLYSISSGGHRGEARITKRGRPLLRRHLFLAACRLSKSGAPFDTYCQRLSQRKAGPVYLVGGCRKLLRLMVALVRDDKVYEPGRVGVPVISAA